jgi:hypothetical protein
VYGYDDVSERDVSSVVGIVKGTVDQFGLPLSVLTGGTDHGDKFRVDEIMRAGLHTDAAEFNFDEVLARLNEVRKERHLQCGLAILIDHRRFKLSDTAGEWGLGSAGGLVILRRFDIRNAVIHEIGHMVGLRGHHSPPGSGCVMEYTCPVGVVCEDCKAHIRKAWKI